MSENQWRKTSPSAVVNKVSQARYMGWDDDSRLAIMAYFIEAISSPKAFEGFVIRCADEEDACANPGGKGG